MTRRRTRLQDLLIGLLLVLMVGFGALTIYRTACLSRKMGDLNVYLRAGWAIRAGVSPYDIVCDNHWHYVYPPPYAILMAPLGDPPQRDAATTAARILGTVASPTGIGPLEASVGAATSANPLPPDTLSYTVPFVVSSGLFYLLNLVAALVGVHLLASALERGQPRDDERWWALRLAPMYICLIPLAHTLMRGQVNTLVLFLVCGLIAGLIVGHAFRAGLYLAGAIALKIIPAYLCLLPLWLGRRNCLAGVTVGLVVILGLFPLVVLGPSGTYTCYEQLVTTTLAPGLKLGGDNSRDRELIQTTSTASQSFVAVIHNTTYLDRATRPSDAEPWARQIHWALAGLMLAVTLGSTWRGGVPTGGRLGLFGGALTTTMLMTSPVCHMHYLVLLMPLWMGLIAVHWERQHWQGEPLSWGRQAIHLTFAGALILPHIPGLEILKDTGLCMWLTLFAWGWACAELAYPVPGKALPSEVAPPTPAQAA